MILNGAQQGLAGFAQASDPNFNALLYDPTKPIGQRISILGNTIVARLYHSEATLLPDGRVLVSGSDPQTYHPYAYPEEFRIEVYIPPYLNQGFKQPVFTIAETDWELGGQYEIEVTLFHGATSTMRVSLVAGGLPHKAFYDYPRYSRVGHSFVEHARQRHERRPHHLPRFLLLRDDLYHNSATQCKRLSARLAPAIRARWTDTVALGVGPHRG